MPDTFAHAVRAEFRRALHPPYETLSVVFGNGAIMAICWTLLPASVVAFLFTFHGPLAFALVLASWMYSDVPATNLLGGDATRSVAALSDARELRRMWYAKNAVLWLLVTPICAVVAVGIGIVEGRLATTALTIVWIATVPLGALGFSAWLGVWWPYHPLPLKYRWARRHRWRTMFVRWGALVLLPYGIVPALTAILTLPSIGLWAAVGTGTAKGHRITDAQFAWGLLLAAAVAAVAWPVGHLLGVRFAVRRRAKLTAFLVDPDRG